MHNDWGEGLYGGAAGGCKTETLLMAAAQYVDVPGYAALLLRKTFRDLNQADALIPRSKEWWMNTAAHWSGQDKRWTFPSGATITFGYLEHDDDVYQYQGAAYQMIGVDELTQHTEERYLYLNSRMRKPEVGAIAAVPIRIRGATNPGGVGSEWVKKRFVSAEYLAADAETQFSFPWYVGDRFFIPAKLEDNPSLNMREYEGKLALLDPVTRAQLRHGDWKAHAGGRFKASWWRRYKLDLDVIREVGGSNFWILKDTPRIITLDPATRKGETNDYTAIGVFADLGEDKVAVLDMVRERLAVNEIVPRLEQLCRRWQPSWVGIESCGFQIGLVQQARDGRRYPSIPSIHEMEPAGKSKLTRATPAIIRAEHGLIYLPDDAHWLEEFESELQSFTGDEAEDGFVDQVDVLAYSVIGLQRYGAGDSGEPFFLERPSPKYNPGLTQR